MDDFYLCDYFTDQEPEILTALGALCGEERAPNHIPSRYRQLLEDN
jgi:hypothetical protein